MATAITVRSESLAATGRLAAALAPLLNPGGALCLSGDLGAGKTSFVDGLVRALGGDGELVTSPTFTLENRYPLPERPGRPHEVVHVDLYRPGGDPIEDLVGSMLEAREQGALLAVEWADPVESILQPFLRLTLELEPRGNREEPARRLCLSSVPEGWKHVDRLRAAWEALGEVPS